MSEANRIALANTPDFWLGDLLVKPSTRQIIQHDGKGEVIEPRVMQVLVALARSPGRVVSRDELIACCWDDRIVGDDAINRILSRVRRISDGIGKDRFRIETITKVGYRLTLLQFASASESRSLSLVKSSVRRLPLRFIRYSLGAVAIVFVMLAAAYFVSGKRLAARDPVPGDRVAAALYLRARDDLAQRTRTSLAQSVVELQRVNQLAPDFAPAFASLADAYLLEQEVGSLPGEIAFSRAEQAASRARRLDSDLPAAYRALGFIAYWRDGDRPETGAMFRRALSSDGDDAQTNFWFANILADNGQDADALRKFDRARLLDPGSENIAADMAWADWSAGRTAAAKSQLAAIVAKYPENVEARDCYSIVLLATGDYAGYLAQLSVRARLRGEPALLEKAAKLNTIMARSGGPGLQAEMFRQAMLAQEDIPNPNHAEAAFIASLAGDRSSLISVLTLAIRNREQWGSEGYKRQIASRWNTDERVPLLLGQLKAPLIS